MSLRKPQQCAKPGRPFGHNTTFLLIWYAWKQTTSEYLKITWRTDVHFTIVSVQMKFQECLENLDQESRLYAGVGDTILIYNDSWLDHFERDQECRVWWQWHPAPLNHPLAYWGPSCVQRGLAASYKDCTYFVHALAITCKIGNFLILYYSC